MQYRAEENKIVALSNDNQFMGELSFPAVQNYHGRVVIERVFVAPDARGKGIAAELVRRFVQVATERKLTVKLMCPYAIKQFGLHPEYQQLLLPEDRFLTQGGNS